MKHFNIYNEDYKRVLRLNVTQTLYYGESDYEQFVSKPIKATKENIKHLKSYIDVRTVDFVNTAHDCNGSIKVSLKLKIKKGKAYLIMRKQFNY